MNFTMIAAITSNTINPPNPPPEFEPDEAMPRKLLSRTDKRLVPSEHRSAPRGPWACDSVFVQHPIPPG